MTKPTMAVSAVGRPGECGWPPRAILFDCYGTLLQINDQRRPYLHLASLAGGRLDPSPMIVPLSLAGVVERNIVPIDIGLADLAALEADLQAEIASVVPLANALDVLVRLRSLGYLLAVVSNLALPYAEPARDYLSELVDTLVFSFEVGAVKPSTIVFEEACRRLEVRSEDALMVGDSLRNDYHGATDAGLGARHLTSDLNLWSLLNDLLLSARGAP